MSDTILTARDGAVFTITFNRPDKLNAFNAEMSLAFKAAVEAAGDEGIRAVIVTGAGRGFSAGQDLSDRMVADGGQAPDLGVTIETYWNPIARALRALPKPVICAINGVAAGAAANLALACDIVIAARSAKFIQPFSRLGLVPDAGGTWTLTHRLGEARAKGLAMLGEPLSAEDAKSWGLIWNVVDDAGLMAEAMRLARHFATQPTYGLGLIKQAVHAAAVNSFDAHLDLERDLQRKAGRAPDYAEGVRAFLGKRPPVFTGKAP